MYGDLHKTPCYLYSGNLFIGKTTSLYWGAPLSLIAWHTNTSWWRHQMETFSALLALCAGNSPVPVNSPHKGQWRGALMFTLICARINDWVNNREAGDLRRHLDHYDVSVMVTTLWRGNVFHIAGFSVGFPSQRASNVTLEVSLMLEWTITRINRWVYLKRHDAHVISL